MKDRLLVVILLLAALLLTPTPGRTISGDNEPLQNFDRDACYNDCPCNISGFEQACGECMQKCEREFWKAFDEKMEKITE